MKQAPCGFPDKLYYRIGEVSEITGLESHVLRFWETEFRGISPKRTPSGQRLYRKKDVELILTIRDLLHRDRFTIQGAKKHLAEGGQGRKTRRDPLLAEIRKELESIRDLLAQENPL